MNNTELLYFAAGLATAIAFYLGWYIVNLSREITQLKRRMDIFNGATKRVKKHNSYNENQALEDAMSSFLRVEVEDELHAKTRRALIETGVAILIALRKGEYQPDKPLDQYLKEREQL